MVCLQENTPPVSHKALSKNVSHETICMCMHINSIDDLNILQIHILQSSSKRRRQSFQNMIYQEDSENDQPENDVTSETNKKPSPEKMSDKVTNQV